MTCLVLYLTGHMFDYLRTIVWLNTAPYTVIRTRLFSNGTLSPCRTGLSAGVCGLTTKSVKLCIYIVPRYDPGSTSYAVKCCIAFPRPNILESLSPTTYPGTNRSVKWQQKRIPHSISYLETWSIAPDLWDRLPTAPLHIQAWSVAPVSGILICRRIKSDWRRLTDEQPELSSPQPDPPPPPPPPPPWRPADITSGCALCTRYHTGLLQCHSLVLFRQLEISEDIRENTSIYPPLVIRLNFLFSHGARVGVNSGVGVGIGVETSGVGVGVGIGVDIQETCQSWSWSWSWNSRSWSWSWSWYSSDLPELELELELKLPELELELELKFCHFF